MKTSLFNNFTNLYSLSKTLKFELIPEGRTETTIKEKKLVEQDEARALNYQTMKVAIDEYHKSHIKQSLPST